MRYLKKIQCLLIALLFTLAIFPFKSHAADSMYKIVGWYDENRNNCVTGVKINGVEISKYNPSVYDYPNPIQAAPSSTLSVEIELEEGYDFTDVEDGSKLLLNGVQSRESVTSSSGLTSIDLPTEDCDEEDDELYLSFKTVRDSQSNTINSVTLNVTPPVCGTEINSSSDPAPEVSVPSGKGYRIAENSINWVKKEGSNYVENAYPLTMTGSKEYIFKIDLIDRGSYSFSDDLEKSDITINNGKLLDYSIETRGDSTQKLLCLTVSVKLTHIAGPTVEKNATGATCTTDGKHDEEVTCTVCGEQISYKSVIDEEAFGHDWGEWEIIKEPTVYEEGIKQRVCKNDSSHVQTETIPCLESCTVTFDVQGHGTAPEPQKVEIGKTATEPKNMSAAGYTFCGWYTDQACTKAFDFDSPITEDITLYAKWVPGIYLRTGDNANILLWSTLFGLSLTAITYITIKKNRKVCEK